MIRAIAFDAYGTLFDVYSIATLAEKLFPGHGNSLAALWRDRQIDYTRLRTLSGRHRSFWHITEDALVYACRALRIPLEAEQHKQLMAQYAVLQAFPENLAALQKLKHMGMPLAILSNGTPAMLASAVDHAGMTGIFDYLLSVESVQKYKTSPEAYALAPTAFDLPARDILFVSSNAWDACGATWYGFTTFWINRSKQPCEELGITPHAEGFTLDDVVTFVSAETR